jgi:hypothetical protein
VNRKEFVCDTVPAKVIPVADLALDFDELPKTLAAFSAEIALKFHHAGING